MGFSLSKGPSQLGCPIPGRLRILASHRLKPSAWLLGIWRIM
jgi:hypothetical protein